MPAGRPIAPLLDTAKVILFEGSAARKREELARGDDDPAPAELSTVESTITSGLRHSLRTIEEALQLVRTHETWTDWSPAAREARNRLAGTRKLGL